MDVEQPVVEVAPGCTARGRRMGPAKSCESPVYAFLGLPYAKPPTGPLRFQPPRPADLWTGDRDATQHGAVSPQDMDTLTSLPGAIQPKAPTNISEDCLFLNVWTSTLKSDAKKPVMVFIHGGGFVLGYSDYYYGTAFVGLGDVVLVTINYRLNVFGFMTTGDDVMSGNYGLLDQIEALKWVKKNISAFGGDPENVTIFGESAGGCSVSALLVTKYSRGLFHRAICQSGTIHAPWTLATSKELFTASKAYLEGVGCTSQTSQEILVFLRNLSADDLFKGVTPTSRFSPVIDGDVIKAEDVRADVNSLHPEVDVMIGVNSHEGSMFAEMMGLFTSSGLEPISKALPELVDQIYGENTPAVCALTMEEYFDESMSDEQMLKACIQWMGDFYFVVGSLKTAEMQANGTARTYMYYYSYHEPLSHHPDWVGADHSDELNVQFGLRLMKEEISEQVKGLEEVEISEESEEMSRKFIALITNFARNGNPNGSGLPDWPQYTKDNKEYLIIDTSCSIGRNMMSDKATFWEEFLIKFPPSYAI